jgi:MFS family permease
VIFGAQWWQTRGLPEGVAPPLEGVLHRWKRGKSSRRDAERWRWTHGERAPTLVAFWATWCPVCTAEEDNIVAVAREHRVVSVAMQSGDAATVAKHLRERGHGPAGAGRCRWPPRGELARARGADAFRRRWRRQHPLSRRRLRHHLGAEGALVVGGDISGMSDSIEQREPPSPLFPEKGLGDKSMFPPLALAWSVWGLGALLYLIGFYQRVAPAVITDQLMLEFAIGGAALGNLSAFYFYSYVAMQIPTGMIADRWGPRRLLTVGAGVAALGTALFAFAPTIFLRQHGAAPDRRFGGGRLRLHAQARQPLVPAGEVRHGLGHGAVDGRGRRRGGRRAAALPGRDLRLAAGDGGLGAVTVALCIATWLRVRDDPVERGYASHFQGVHGAHEGTSLWRGLMEVLSYRNVWILTAVPIGFSGAVLTFAGLWGVPFLRQVHGLDPKTAAAITSTLLVSWAWAGRRWAAGPSAWA